MQPKKKDIVDYLVPILLVLVVIYMALQSAPCLDIAMEKYQEALETISVEKGLPTDAKAVTGDAKREALPVFFEAFQDRLTNNSTEFDFHSPSLPKTMAIAIFILLMGFGWYYTSRKKFINGKEYGSARWATASDLTKYRAKYVLKQDIKSIKKKNHGTARKKKIADAKIKNSEASEIIYTQTERASMYSPQMANNNTLIIGGSGSWKTSTFVVPNILQCNSSKYSPSIVVTDPKGEIVANVGCYLESQGYDIVVLDLKEQEKSFCFNPFMYISDDKYDKQIPWVVQNLMKCKEEEKSKNNQDPFWEQMTEIVLTALSFAIYMGFPKEEQHIGTVAELYSWFEAKEHDDREHDPTKLDKFFIKFGDADGVCDVVEAVLRFYRAYLSLLDDDSARAVLSVPQYIMTATEYRNKLGIPIGTDSGVLIDNVQAEIARLTLEVTNAGRLTNEISEASDDAITEILTYKEARKTNYEGFEKPAGVQIYERFGVKGYANPAIKYWDDFRNNVKGKTAQSACATVIGKLAPFSEFQIKRIMSKDQMKLDEMGERKIALFVVLPPTEKRYNFIVTILYSLLFQRLEYCATVTHRDTQKLPIPVKFILDEFYNTGEIKSFLNILSYARSFGISVNIIIQSLDQIKEMYEKSWGLILDNCSGVLFLGGIKHYDTLKYLSDLLGKGTFDKRSHSRTKGRQSSYTTNDDKLGRELMTPDELQTMPRNKCILFLAGTHAFYSTKFFYKGHRNYKYTLNGNKKFLYDYNPPEDDKEVTRGEENEVIKNALEAEIEVKENETTIKPISRPPIVLDFEGEKTVEEISLNMQNYTLVSANALLDDDVVFDEFTSIVDGILASKEEERKAEMDEIKSFIKRSPIALATDDKSVAQSIAEIVQTPIDNIVVSSDDVSDITQDEVSNLLDSMMQANESQNQSKVQSSGSDDEFEDDSAFNGELDSLLAESLSLINGIGSDFTSALQGESGSELDVGTINAMSDDESGN